MEQCGLVWSCVEKFRQCQNDINAPFCWRLKPFWHITYMCTYLCFCYTMWFLNVLYFVFFVVSPSVNKESSWQPVLSSGLRHHTHDSGGGNGDGDGDDGNDGDGDGDNDGDDNNDNNNNNNDNDYKTNTTTTTNNNNNDNIIIIIIIIAVTYHFVNESLWKLVLSFTLKLSTVLAVFALWGILFHTTGAAYVFRRQGGCEWSCLSAGCSFRCGSDVDHRTAGDPRYKLGAWPHKAL